MTRTALAGLLSILALPATAGPDALGCFTRTYDRAHLARHPDQVVTAVKLRIYRPPPDSGAKYWFDAEFRVRGRNKPLRTTGLCSEKASGDFGFAVVPDHAFLHCGVECDGGGVDVVPRARDAMMYLDRIRVAACDEDLIDGGKTAQELTGGKDDRVFRLDRVDDAACVRMDATPGKASRPSEPDDLYTNAEKIPLCHAGLIKLASFAEHLKFLRELRRYDVDGLIQRQRKGGPEFFSSQIIVQRFLSGTDTSRLRTFHGLSEPKYYRNVTHWDCQAEDFPIVYFVGFRVRKIKDGTIFVSREKDIVNVISLKTLDPGLDNHIKVQQFESAKVLCPDLATGCDHRIFYSREY